VRALKALSVILLVITFIWWILLLVSMFVTPPMMQTRGSGFFNFSYTTLTLGNLIFGLLFFAVPSKPMTVWGLVLAVLLFADMIIISSFPRIRTQEGWVGIVSVVWAALIAIYNVGQNQAVAKGKHEEEERLTGRVETRRSLLEWLAVFAETVIVAIIAIVAILLTATLIIRARDASLESPGKMYLVDNGKYAVHLACVGVDNGDHGSTLTVLLEAGERPVEASLQPFIDTLYQNGTIDRYCYWDRPGFAWSDNAPSPHSAGMSADSLAQALALAGEEGPWVLVSADIGGLYSRIFASRHAHEVHGILLIDTLHEDDLQNVGRPGRGFMLWLRGVISPLGLDRLTGAVFKGRAREDRVFGQSTHQNGRYIKAKLQENLVAGPITSNEITTARHIQARKTQLVVVSSGLEVRRSEKWAKKQEDLTKITDNLISWDVVKNAPHDVWTASEGRMVLAQRLKQLVNKNRSRQTHF
jgi:pimeloyl-ACP methyl ester carboxylesterase